MANSPPILRYDRKAPKKWSKCSPPGVNKPQTAQKNWNCNWDTEKRLHMKHVWGAIIIILFSCSFMKITQIPVLFTFLLLSLLLLILLLFYIYSFVKKYETVKNNVTDGRINSEKLTSAIVTTMPNKRRQASWPEWEKIKFSVLSLVGIYYWFVNFCVWFSIRNLKLWVRRLAVKTSFIPLQIVAYVSYFNAEFPFLKTFGLNCEWKNHRPAWSFVRSLQLLNSPAFRT